MEAERWQKLDRLYHEALQHDNSLRPAFVAQACAGDEPLRDELLSFLAGSEASGSFLEQPALEVAAQDLARSASAREHPAVIGRYRIVRPLGEGGMGIVYEAEQEQPRRVVALKLIRPGLATAERLWRFEQEGQALGRLQHPGIARIYEAGAAETGFGPQPYFAMELIRGCPLDRYAGANRLDVRGRLALVAQVCEAVHHAHQHGLIHRDLKPANILVDETGQPKIVDFGVARVTGTEAATTHQTDLGQLVGTLAYMSPEQVMGDPLEVDTRTDIYSLGVILYELLSGRLPYTVNPRQLPEAVQTIRENDPAALSSINRHYRGDIETIVGKALEKDKARRYVSAADLALDIRRYLRDEPISARPPSTAYQLQKFARRHRALVAGTAVVFLVLIAGIAASTWQAIRASRAERTAVAAEAKAVAERNRAVAEKQRADEEAATAIAISDFLQNDLLRQASLVEQGRDTKPDPEIKVRTALDRAAARIPGKFQGRPMVEAAIRQAIGTTYLNLNLPAEAGIQMEKVLELRRQALGDDHPDTAQAMQNLAVLYNQEGKTAQAEALLIKVLEVRRRTLGEEAPLTLSSLSSLASVYRTEGRYAQAEPMFLKAVALRRRILGEHHRDTGMSMHNLAVLYCAEGKYATGESYETKALEIFRAVLGDENPVTLLSMNNLAEIYKGEGKYRQAESLWKTLLEVRRRQLGATHPDTTAVMASLRSVQLIEARSEPLVPTRP